jgi:GxxExxY protein
MNLETIKNLCIDIFDGLGTGFNEVVYQKALEVELRLHRIDYERERIIPVIYKDHQVGVGRADIIVDNQIILELKAISNLTNSGKELKQLEHYLNYTGLVKGLVINFNQSSGEVDFREIEIVDD